MAAHPGLEAGLLLDQRREQPWVEAVLARGLLGEKTGKGFYERRKSASGGREIWTLDPISLDDLHSPVDHTSPNDSGTTHWPLWLPDGRLLIVSMSDRRLVTLEADGLLAEDPLFQASLEQERQELEDEMSDFKAWPAISLGFFYRF